MPERDDLSDLPILAELGDELARGFARAERPAAAPSSPVPRRPRRWRALALAGAATAAACAVGVVGLAGGGPGGPDVATAAAALHRAADRAARTPAAVPTSDDAFWYVDELALDAGINGELTGRKAWTFSLGRRQSWTSPGRTGAAIDTPLERSRPGELPPRLRPEALGAAGPPPPRDRPGRPTGDGSVRAPLSPGPYYLGGEALTAAELRSFPTDPRVIESRLRRSTAGQGRSPNGEVWVAVNDALRTDPLTPELAAGLLRVLAGLPGVVLGSETTDLMGRRALPVSYQEPGTWERETLLLDPRTYARLGHRTEIAGRVGTAAPGVLPTRTTDGDGTTTPLPPDPSPVFPAGTVVSESLVLDSGVRSSVDPGGGAP